MPPIPRGRNPLTTSVALLVCFLLAGFLTACGQEGTSGAAPLSERSENDVPLNPPTLKFYVAADGEVGASPELVAEAGEAIALVLENDSGSDDTLRFLGPDGGTVFAVDAPAIGPGDGRALPRDVGTHVGAQIIHLDRR